LKLRKSGRLTRLPRIGSDHFPIYSALSYEHTAEFTQEEPEATREEEEESIEILEEAAEILREERESEEKSSTTNAEEGAHEIRARNGTWRQRDAETRRKDECGSTSLPFSASPIH